MPNVGDTVLVNTAYGPLPGIVVITPDSGFNLVPYGITAPTGTQVILTPTDLGDGWDQPVLMDVGTEPGTYAVIS